MQTREWIIVYRKEDSSYDVIIVEEGHEPVHAYVQSVLNELFFQHGISQVQIVSMSRCPKN